MPEPRKIEALNLNWNDASAKAMFEYYEAEIAKAFVLPPHLVGADYHAQREFWITQHRATEMLREMMVRLSMYQATPLLLLEWPW